MSIAVTETSLAGLPVVRGKVRDVYDMGEYLLFVATDRISAYDWILPTGIPDKGRILTAMSLFWFDFLGVTNHLVSTDLASIQLPPGTDLTPLAGRSMIVKKAQVVPIECVARGYLAGSGWREYQESQTVCGIPLPTGLQNSSRLPEPIFTPATKATSGHDMNIAFDEACEIAGAELMTQLRTLTLDVYRRAAEYAGSRGIILADTKFEWGVWQDQVILVDEVLTPDSSRFWPADDYAPGQAQASFDKQFVRDWLDSTSWDKNSPPPELPEEIVAKTRAKYVEAYERLSGETFAWK